VAEGEPARSAPDGARPRAPSLLDAILPVAVLIALIPLTIALFGATRTHVTRSRAAETNSR
jgi:hypothetical protein